MNETLGQQETDRHIALLRKGDEKGLNFFYRRFYGYISARAFRATQDDCAAKSIAQEALLRLWLFRKQLKDAEDIQAFLKAQVRSSINAYYNKTRNRFHRSLLRLDSIEDYQEFLLGHEMEEEEEMDIVYLERLDQEKQQRLVQLENLMPSLNGQQQMFIKLCLKYSFNYERIAYYLGGISDYQVSLQVEKTIDTLRSIFNSSQKIEQMNRSSKIVAQGELDEQQAEIFHMRYQLQLSFDQISEALHLDPSTVRKIFVQAHTKIRTAQKTA